MTKREHGRLLNIPPEVYQHRKERLKDRIQAVLSYLYNEAQGIAEKIVCSHTLARQKPSLVVDVMSVESVLSKTQRKPSFQIAKAVLDSQLKDNDLSLTTLH